MGTARAQVVDRLDPATGHHVKRSTTTSRVVPARSKAMVWGAGVMGVAGLAGAVLGPSPLLLPFAPLVAIAYVPFAIASAPFGTPMGLAELGVGGKAVFVVWSGMLGAGAGRLIGAWCARRRKRGAGN